MMLTHVDVCILLSNLLHIVTAFFFLILVINYLDSARGMFFSYSKIDICLKK